MIGTIRKHSAWLWWIIAGLTIISFVVFMGSGPSRNGGGGRVGDFGVIYGREVTPEMYARAKHEFYLYYWRQYGKFPSIREGVSDKDIQRETYIRLLLAEKARLLGIRVPESAVTAGTAELLNSLGGRGSQAPTLEQFAQRVLAAAPEPLSINDLANFIRSDIAIQQTIMTLGLPGSLVSPQEASQLYDREYQEVSAQAVFFSYSNYLSKVTVTPAATQDFYTKNMAAYRVPDRLQVNYVTISLSNFAASAEMKIGKTNLDNTIDSIIRQRGMEAVPGATNMAEAKEKIREALLRKEEAELALALARDFSSVVYAKSNFAAAAQGKNLPIRNVGPFAATAQLDGLPENFVAAAFKMKMDEQPFSEMVSGTDAVYFLAMDKQFPSTVPTLEQLGTRVNDDYRAVTAQQMARSEGALFATNVTAQVAAGKTFAEAAAAAGHAPVMLKPFSLQSPAIPEAGDRAEVGEIKQAAFTTPLKKVSQFFPTSEGGFVLSPQAMEPVDTARKNSILPDFIKQVRRGRQNQAFNEWLQQEANRELRTTPFYAEMAGVGKPQ